MKVTDCFFGFLLKTICFQDLVSLIFNFFHELLLNILNFSLNRKIFFIIFLMLISIKEKNYRCSRSNSNKKDTSKRIKRNIKFYLK